LREMHALDINCIVRELQSLIGSRVDKVFQDKSGVVRIRFYGSPAGRAELLIEAGRRLHLTEYRRSAPKTPTSFAMYLRKHLGNRPLSEVTQHDFDRIVILTFVDLRLVAEIFARGNIILLDSDSKVMLSMKRGPEERVTRGSRYNLPKPPVSPFDIRDPSGLRQALRHADLVRSLAVDLGLGRLYANELCAATGLQKEIKPSQISDEQASAILDWIRWVQGAIATIDRPLIYGSIPEEFSPFELKSLSGLPVQVAESFNQAADRCYAQEEMGERAMESSDLQAKKLGKLEKRLQIQRTQLEGLLTKARELRKQGDTIYANFSSLSALLSNLDMRSPSQNGLEERFQKMGVSGEFLGYDPATKTLKMKLKGTRLSIDLRLSLGENANRLYEKAKNLERRAEGARLAMAKTEELLKRSEAERVEAPKPLAIKSRRREWYERFRWFLSSEGFLVLSGRDAHSNEALVRRYLEPQDIYVHADVQGAPSTVVKVGEGEVGERTLIEASAFALIHSRLWKSGTLAGDAYWVAAEQVTKRPTSGEYVPRGAFIIRGKRNYFRGLEARCGIGWFKERFMCGPLEAVLAHCPRVLEIAPGEGKKSDIAKRIASSLAPQSSDVDLDQVMQVLPPGRLRIVEERGSPLKPSLI